MQTLIFGIVRPPNWLSLGKPPRRSKPLRKVPVTRSLATHHRPFALSSPSVRLVFALHSPCLRLAFALQSPCIPHSVPPIQAHPRPVPVGAGDLEPSHISGIALRCKVNARRRQGECKAKTRRMQGERKRFPGTETRRSQGEDKERTRRGQGK